MNDKTGLGPNDPLGELPKELLSSSQGKESYAEETEKDSYVNRFEVNNTQAEKIGENRLRIIVGPNKVEDLNIIQERLRQNKQKEASYSDLVEQAFSLLNEEYAVK